MTEGTKEADRRAGHVDASARCISLKASAFRAVTQAALEHARRGRDRPVMRCVNIVAREETITFLAGDGWTLVELQIDAASQSGRVETNIDREHLEALLRLYEIGKRKRDDRDVMLAICRHGVRFRLDDGSLDTFVEGAQVQYPRPDSLWDGDASAEAGNRVAIQPHHLASIARGAAKLGAPCVRLHVHPSHQPARFEYASEIGGCEIRVRGLVMPLFVRWDDSTAEEA